MKFCVKGQGWAAYLRPCGWTCQEELIWEQLKFLDGPQLTCVMIDEVLEELQVRQAL